MYNIKIPELSTKDIVDVVCMTKVKAKYYTLKPEYVD
jgi:hypothetical protein